MGLNKLWGQAKILASTMGISAIIIAILILSVVAVPFVLGIGIMLAVYIFLRIMNEDVDPD